MVGLHQDLIGNLAMFCALCIAACKTPRRKGFWLRMLLGLVLFSLARYSYSTYVSVLFTGNVARWISMTYFAMFIPLLAVAALVCWEMDFWAGLYCGCSAYCVQHIANKGYDMVRRAFLSGADKVVYYLAFTVLILAALIFFYVLVRQRREDRVHIDSKALLMLSLLIVITAVMLDILARGAIHGAQPSAYYIVNWYSIIAAAIILCFQQTLVSSKNKEAEIKILRSLLKEQEDQYRFEKSIIETLNIKVHDVKHQIQGMNETSRQRVKEELAPVLESYDSRFRTENPALDVILTRKSFVCQEKRIHLTVMADGHALDFMRGADIYALFGNMLDNAIEATELLAEEEKKVIKLSVEKKGYFIHIHQENYFAQTLEFEDGLPKTTKMDVVNHGFGMKSIRMLAEQYDGNVKIDIEEDRFVLNICFPI